jgi:hypothetical protein
MASTPFEKIAKHLSGSNSWRKRRWDNKQYLSSFWLFPPPRNRGVYFVHGIPVDERNATLYFLSLSLRVSVVNLLSSPSFEVKTPAELICAQERIGSGFALDGGCLSSRSPKAKADPQPPRCQG